ncbi:MAG: cell division protein ZipA C-terminal FtsZ-binding domain-containing protein [Steroidobacteraceae bacterium]
MSLSTQLRLILLIAGGVVLLAIVLLGRRKSARPAQNVETEPSVATPAFGPVEELDEDELDTPAYMRRQGQREARQDYEPRIASAHDYVDIDETSDDSHLLDLPIHGQTRTETRQIETPAVAASRTPPYEIRSDEPVASVVSAPAPPDAEPAYEPVYAEPVYAAPASQEPTWSVAEADQDEVVDEPLAFGTHQRREPSVSFDNSFDSSFAEAGAQQPVHDPEAEAAVLAESEPPTIPAMPAPTPNPVPVVADPVATPVVTARPVERSITGHGAAPTLSEPMVKPEPVARAGSTPPAANHQKPGNTAARRKIIALRLSIAERIEGARLLSLLEGERLQHGKFNIFHRLHEGATVFSVASMVEPGSFDPQQMSEQQFPGVTLFMLLPGPLDGLVAYDQMLSCAQRLAHQSGGLLQDERGSKLTQQSMDKLRDEVLDFQHLLGSVVVS